MRTEVQAQEIIDELTEKYCGQGYGGASKAQRGIPVSRPFNNNYAMLQTVRDNQLVPTLTDEQRDNILDYLIVNI